MSSQRFTQVDSFTDEPFRGNPAAVCVLPRPREAEWMQHVAQEMNLAETAFLVRQGDDFGLRWFTPTLEVDLCGHATLASAHVLWEEGWLSPDSTARFHSRSGVLTASRHDGLIWLDFPATPAQPAEAPSDLTQGLNVPLQYVGRTSFDYLVEVESEAVIRGLTPDLVRLNHLDTRGVIVTARADSNSHDFVSRFFAPGAGDRKTR
jgi:PhzF family phenazine biosynthesis protein